MEVTIELTNEIVWAIAHSEAAKSAYDRLEKQQTSLDDMYATAFHDGVMWSLAQLNKEKQRKTAEMMYLIVCSLADEAPQICGCYTRYADAKAKLERMLEEEKENNQYWGCAGYESVVTEDQFTLSKSGDYDSYHVDVWIIKQPVTM
jgi:hypothetical protein